MIPDIKLMSLSDFQVMPDGIFIPRDEVIRMIEESYRIALEYGKMKESEFHAAMLRSEGSAHVWEHILEKIDSTHREERDEIQYNPSREI